MIYYSNDNRKSGIVKLRHSEFQLTELTEPNEIECLTRRLLDSNVVACDTETEEIIDGFHPIGKGKCFSIQLGIGNETWFIPTWGKYRINLDILKPYLIDPRRTKVLHNSKFDMHILANHGIEMQGLLCDTMVAEYTWYNDLFYPEVGDRFPAHFVKVYRGLKNLCSMYFDEDLPDYKEVFTDFTAKKRGGSSRNTKGKIIKRNAILQNLIDYERTIGGHDTIVEYASKDPYLTLKLYDHVKPRLEKEQWFAKSRKGKSLWDYFQEIEVPFTNALFMMERVGMPLDWEALDKLDSAFDKDDKRLRIEWDQELERAGAKRSYNIASNQDVAEALTIVFDQRLDKRGKTKEDGSEGTFSVDKEVLKSLSHPVAELILDWREINKLKGTYTEKLRDCYNYFGGKVHTTLNQIGTRTGRISSNDPNLLNVPARSESGKAIRACFCAADSSEEIGCIDWDSAELRETFLFSREPVIGNILDQGLKQHAVTAGDIDPEARAWRNGRTDAATYKELEKKFPQAYFMGKTFNFGAVYGMGYKKFAKLAKISEKQAKEAHNAYWNSRTRLKEFQEHQAALAVSRGYILDILGVPIWIGEAGSADSERKSRGARKAGNSIIQGSIGKRAKLVMILLTHDDYLKKQGYKLAINIYDEFVSRAPKGCHEANKTYIEERVRNPLKFFGANADGWEIEGSLGWGNNWMEAKYNG